LNKAITLIELLIAIALLSVVVLGFTSIDMFSRYHVLTSDRRAKLQNEVSLALEHMAKQVSRAVGNKVIAGQNPIILDNIAGDSAIKVHVDSNGDGQADNWIAYRFNPSTDSESSQIWYCSTCTNFPCTTCDPAWGSDIIARRIHVFNPALDPAPAVNNLVNINITACWDQSAGAVYNTPDNPCVNMRTSIKMPSVSTN